MGPVYKASVDALLTAMLGEDKASVNMRVLLDLGAKRTRLGVTGP